MGMPIPVKPGVNPLLIVIFPRKRRFPQPQADNYEQQMNDVFVNGSMHRSHKAGSLLMTCKNQ